ncbi:enoyl-CoA hydratase/isomerase family protein [Oceanibacterium hippocampi]|nr:enoyl-CoA hydratase/isomerase family protein [Oceanibacterium hippocampi]
MQDYLIVEDLGRTRILTINRPDKLNALNRALVEGLTAALVGAERDPAIVNILLTGSPKAFSAGVDLKETAKLENEPQFEAHAGRVAELFLTLNRMSKPTFAAVEGYALGGGCGLALACDIIVAGSEATFGYPEITRGLMPALVTPNLVQRAGRRKAFEFLAFGRRYSAADMMAAGLANAVVPAGTARDEALRWAESSGAGDPQIFAWIKELITVSETDGLEAGLNRARELNATSRRLARSRKGGPDA